MEVEYCSALLHWYHMCLVFQVSFQWAMQWDELIIEDCIRSDIFITRHLLVICLELTNDFLSQNGGLMLRIHSVSDTPRHLYFVHTFTWLLNMFGIFFILSAHEHYSIDVFVAFYITSRLFLYYHTLANNQALMQRDSNRTRIWFPLFSFFESSVDGIVPNEYESPLIPLRKLFMWLRERLGKLVSLTVQESHSRLRHSDSKNK